MLIVDKMGMKKYVLKNYYRIGYKIVWVVDWLMVFVDGEDFLESILNYNVKLYGILLVCMYECSSCVE